MAFEKHCVSDLDLPFVDGSSKRQRTGSELANMTISKLGEDVLVEILIRGLASPRSACRCKLVCKRWCSLISSPRFNRRFVSHRQTMNLNFPPLPADPFELKSTILGFLSPMPDEVRDRFRVLDCKKDLTLCGFWDIKRDNGERSRSYLVCNPFTKQWVALPLAPRNCVGYLLSAASLVFEPRISNVLDVGDDQAFVYSEYRFRVVCLYQLLAPAATAIKLDVFCSESGKWTKDALVCNGHVRAGQRSLISCNGELFWRYSEGFNRPDSLVARFNPFCLDMPPTTVDVSAFYGKPQWFICGSQGGLHVIALENEIIPVRSSVWRLEEDGKSWRKQCEGLVNKTSKCCNYEVECCHRPYLHPHKPDNLFFQCTAGVKKNAIFCCNLRTEELEFVAKVEWLADVNRIQVFQPRVSCWPTPIPRYEELRGIYDGCYSFWVQSSTEAKTPPLPPSLSNCMGHVMKLASYKDYIEHLHAEKTLHMVAEIIKCRKRKISSQNVSSERQPGSPISSNENELDVLKADLIDVEADIAALAEQTKELKKALLREAEELPYPPPGPMKSVFGREPSRWGVKHIMGAVMRGIDSLKFKGNGTSEEQAC